ncbi:peptidase S13 (D-alanyl-D-alanine carboxypeptidase [Gordonia spumicola]|uniref:Peptidase S13 (D-alanyl-D-alanine carboxypeptidase) n=1 Tax=Gordonia spumicola TaxID=589161 RepID=A0A7I9V4S1_9ACTN|nr:D-alanyl-D-alanine carboxypeptidase/D-alanyl-D-alanine-endopeptidase [Gordonia spumicola]GEE00011.1 peptidase S13 (D-alanyl-D-alanine carboxypeptidase [Gordonia spumicola]
MASRTPPTVIEPTAEPVRKSRKGLWIALSLLLVVLLAGGGTAAWWFTSQRPDPVPAGTPARPGPVTVDQVIRAVSDSAPIPTAAGVRGALAKPSRAAELGDFTGQVTDPVTGTVLWSRHADQARTPASNAKILTAAAALMALPHDKRITTTVVLGDDGQAILVGAGDPTLTSGDDEQTFYSDPGRISDLAAQIKRSGVPVTSVAFATPGFTGPSMVRTWDRRDIEGGDIAPLSSLMIDAGRRDPMNEYSPRTDQPAEEAGRALADALGVHGEVKQVDAPTGARTIASVQSAPLSVRVGDMMRFSDNVLAEMLGVELAEATGKEASTAGGVAAVLEALRHAGFDVDDVKLNDLSGLSYADKVPAGVLDSVMAATVGGDRSTKLRSLLDTLPVAHGTGTLSDRFDPSQMPGAGWVRAKTGTLTGVTSLTGIVQTVDGRVLSFALMSGGTSPADARPAIDSVAGALRECGCRN